MTSTLYDGIQRIDAMRMGQAMANLAVKLHETSEVLLRFQEPVVFQAVLVSSIMNRDHVASASGHDGDGNRSVPRKEGSVG